MRDVVDLEAIADPIERARVALAEMDAARSHVAALADIRRVAVAEACMGRTKVAVAAAMGITRQQVYRILDGDD